MKRIVAAVIVAGLVPAGVVAGSAAAATRSAADQALYERAVKTCNGWEYWPNGARPVINYKKGWFRCQEPRVRGKHHDRQGPHR